MKKFIYKVSLLTCFLALASCDKDLENINVDPNKPTEVRTPGLFNGTSRDLMVRTRGAFPSGRMALPWVQYSSQRNYTAEDRYQYREGVNNSLYRDIYLAVKGYKEIIDIVENPLNKAKIAAWGDPKNQIAAARIMIAYAQLQAVDNYGDVPYYSYGTKDPDFEAMTLTTGNEITTPKFAPQEKIYRDLMKELKEASEMINLNAGNVFAEGDNLFRTPLKLKRFANSLRLKIATRVKGVTELSSEAQKHIAEAIQSGVMEGNADSVIQFFQNDKINPAPMYSSAFIDNRNDFAITNTFVELLKGEEHKAGTNPFKAIGQTDPRLFKMAAPVKNVYKGESVNVRFYVNPLDPSFPSIELANYSETDASGYTGFPIGIKDGVTASQRGVSSQFSANIYLANAGEVIMEYAEVAFLLSEVKGWDDAEYKKGVTASMQRWNVPNADITSYVGKLPAANEQTVRTQKYIALFMQPNEAWAEYRRTGFPKTLLLPGENHKLNKKGPNDETEYTFEVFNGLTDLPERFNYPTDMNLINKTNKDAAAQRMGGDKMDTKLIWAKK
ncbi:SusD/RagB family nutrient-binding outer membrane lipoprotein [Myroides marinus]|uniref:SusD/RagB family nutrient-binding outer membrane lipoprotein n=1 Tax=Myroides marinus TaxID=703342 RepID=UPI0025790294|nr:SusD/RagB family nutrient-binding outer membrane lipoprotein [Myroides marinus]MDM1346197.1 SusD/RagB family nutrient-binding outer membrane lipoprotein [Myroides marinus]MDM1349543.1 SusD/RagB family nutrient-binding outer membrane lipoprotein [Myroides marinus]MDM1353795.1 SusD/RagB family nutrient-binding outer membrane lipoprotein [Myroides marinus]MDM1356753.1 SusD/RagB family nutrient-binding outer membrane lipoprotein [Myroides marinus]MDM1363895.1 SusD/RagB family nutrient-binding o